MRSLLLLAAAGLSLCSADQAAGQAALDANLDLIHKFKEFVQKFVKEYESVQEMLHRMTVFSANLGRLKVMQAKDKSGKYSHLSPLMDRTPEEFKALNTLQAKDVQRSESAELLALEGAPSAWDWREKGAVNAVKDQKQCGSCWSFGTVANIEGAMVVQGKQPLISLSEQDLVDCSQSDNGCNGGLPDRAFSDMKSQQWGLALETDYPYTARVGRCRKSSFAQKGFISSWKDAPQDEDQIAAYLVKYGPLVIGINAEPMQMYSGGIADPDDCDPTGLDHAVVLVGYGEEDGQKYWIIRNSWGTWWGEQGYYRVVRGVGRCGLNRMVSTAIVDPKSDIVV